MGEACILNHGKSIRVINFKILKKTISNLVILFSIPYRSFNFIFQSPSGFYLAFIQFSNKCVKVFSLSIIMANSTSPGAGNSV